ncbi:MAG: hypothetical protein QE271_00665 [Bacteriovoracaceae bacterium]|nr:hypothetical protein [Bacteriovoracaceae bacterium]
MKSLFILLAVLFSMNSFAATQANADATLALNNCYKSGDQKIVKLPTLIPGFAGSVLTDKNVVLGNTQGL